MLQSIASFPVLNFPIFSWFGILAFLGFLTAATIAILNQKGTHKIPFYWHPRIAKTSLILALIHAILAASLFF